VQSAEAMVPSGTEHRHIDPDRAIAGLTADSD
jgi:hypothetical protein